MFIHREILGKVIMYCRTTAEHKFRTKLGFKQHDIILIRAQPVLTNIMGSFQRENLQRQYNVLG